MGDYVLPLEAIDRSQRAIVGGKGANLGELTRIDGVHVPQGFCVTTIAFDRAMRAAAVDVPSEAAPMPDDVAAAITAALARLGAHGACAVRSSATAEDLPTASFAGQHDTDLDVVGTGAILRAVARCWGSLFTERAVRYRQQHGIDPRSVRMAVVVQRMVAPRAAGVLFTADPVTGNRRVVSIEAVPGLGEALVSGRTNADVYGVRDGVVVRRPVSGAPLLADAEVVRLAEVGRRIEAHFGAPQDVEWCLADDVAIVQSRPITTLYPVPARGDDAPHVYISTGHQQMMTDAMKPLGLSLRQLTAARPMYEAGGRLFVDVAPDLAAPASRARLLSGMAKSDPLIGSALQTLVDRGDLVPPMPEEHPATAPPLDAPPLDAPPLDAPPPLPTDPAVVEELIARSEASIATLKGRIASKTGPALLDFLVEDFAEMRRLLFDRRSHQALMAGMEATWWLNDRLSEWLGETNAADVLAQSVPNNVTSEMGLALLDVADALRPHREVVAFLRRVENDDFLRALPALPGGQDAHDAITRWLDRYGVRGVGEIDITRPRWSERPSTLLPLLLANVDRFEPGAAGRRFERGRREAARTAAALRERLRALPGGEEKAAEVARMIERLRTFVGYREYPKYALVSRYFVYKRALLAEAERLVAEGVLREAEAIYYLTVPELHDLVRARRVDDALLRRREAEYAANRALTPPRVMTSDGEVIAGAYGRDGVPAGALVGLAVSAGTVEGRARVDPGLGDGRPSRRRHPRHPVHRPELDAALRRHRGARHRGRRADDPRRGHRPRVRPPGRRRRRRRHPPRARRRTDPRPRHRRLRRAPRPRRGAVAPRGSASRRDEREEPNSRPVFSCSSSSSCRFAPVPSVPAVRHGHGLS